MNKKEFEKIVNEIECISDGLTIIDKDDVYKIISKYVDHTETGFSEWGTPKKKSFWKRIFNL